VRERKERARERESRGRERREGEREEGGGGGERERDTHSERAERQKADLAKVVLVDSAVGVCVSGRRVAKLIHIHIGVRLRCAHIVRQIPPCKKKKVYVVHI
jgi:hypothetical protein